MTKIWNTYRAWMLIGLSLGYMTACGGGGSSDRTQIGVLLDSPVSGISYSTPSASGVTNAAGQFNYLPGESVTFSIGGLHLGTAAGSTQVSLFDLAGIATPPSNERELEEQLFPAGNLPGPLNKVVGMASLLQSLDTDGDATNGIEISPDVAALVDVANIRLDGYYWEILAGGNLRDGRGLPGVLRAAAAADLFPERPVVAADRALQHVMDQLGLSISIHGIGQTLVDDDGDGVQDRVRTITYAASGKVVFDEYDTNGDGTTDVSYALEYNNNHQRTSYTRDDNQDGVPEYRTVATFDGFGNMVRNEVFDASGNTTSLETLDFDDLGRLIRRENNNSNTHNIQHWAVDEFGMRSTYELDTDGDGTVDRRDLLQYPPNETRSDRWTQRDIDLDLDGAIDQQQLRSFTPNGLPLTDRTDEDLDGVFERSIEHTYDAFGKATSSITTANGTQNLRWTRNAEGDVTRYEIDRDDDGIYEEVRDSVYDTQGLLAQEMNDTDGDGLPNNIYEYFYDAQGNLLLQERDSNGDGTVDDAYRSTYDSQGRRTSYTFDRNNDGLVEQRTEYSGWTEIGLGGWL